MGRLLVSTAMALGLLAPVAHAQTAKISQLIFARHGDPVLVANPSPDGSKGTVSWSICRPGAAACEAAGTDRGLRAGEQPAGTVFEATVEYQGRRTSDRSPSWRGRVATTQAPTLDGRPAVGERVVPRPASWTGGWGDEYSGLRVQAWRTRIPRVPRCVTLSAPKFVPGPADAGVVVEPRHVGWYLFAVDQRFAAQDVFPSIAYSLETLPPLEPTARDAFSAPYGPVTGPTATIRSRAQYRGGRPLLGTVRCPSRCSVRLVVKADGATFTRRFRTRGTARHIARVGRRAGPGRWRVAVWVDGRRVARRMTRIRP